MSSRSDPRSGVAIDAPMVGAREVSSTRVAYRMPFQLIELGTLAGDLMVILLASIVSGAGYQWLFLDALGNVETYLALGAQQQ